MTVSKGNTGGICTYAFLKSTPGLYQRILILKTKIFKTKINDLNAFGLI